jgi:hypothetical protein
MIGLDVELFRDQINRHLCVMGENLVKHGSYGSQVIYNDDSNTHIRRQMP